ncbi:hypothetical protein APX70_07827, partial [Pseudomonas syringae pv. maculicola]
PGNGSTHVCANCMLDALSAQDRAKLAQSRANIRPYLSFWSGFNGNCAKNIQ